MKTKDRKGEKNSSIIYIILQIEILDLDYDQDDKDYYKGEELTLIISMVIINRRENYYLNKRMKLNPLLEKDFNQGSLCRYQSPDRSASSIV